MHKKIFVHEHTLFSRAQLDKHYLEGDESGFKGHPECEFCQSNFYDDDALYDHCRERHEQCEICKKRGIRNQYYVDPEALVNLKFILQISLNFIIDPCVFV